ncbi:hypothetical protein V6259_10990 [Marinomonas sp. TI.3.20]|uniref:hypothetical protein n=1 Tax=Marinomonas sp. TI.3.20 TaxID=3121296 RepID=UPI00311D3030
MKMGRVLLVFLSVLYLSGCVSSTNVESVAYKGVEITYAKELKNNIVLSSVTGGEDANPFKISNEEFLDALRLSLINQKLFSGEGVYRLSVKLIKIDQPVFGSSFEVKTYVQYTLKNTLTHSTVFNDTISAPYTATFGDAFLGFKRLRLANEGSANKNIEMFLSELADLKITPTQILL